MKPTQHSTSGKQGTRNRRGWVKTGLPVAAAVIIVGGGGYYYVSHRPVSAATVTSIRWVSVQQGTVQQTMSMSGTLNPVKQVSLTGNGNLTSASVKVGDKVKAGQKIAQIDTSSYTPQLQEAQASVQAAKAKLAQAEEPATVPSGQSNTTTTQSSNANVIAQDEASVTQAEAQLNSINQEIAACTITTPIAGTVLSVANPNQTQSQGTSSSSASSSSYGGGSSSSNNSANIIAEIADLSASDFEVQANVAQSDAPNVKAGQTAEVSLGSSGPTVSGKVVSISYIPQSSSGVTTYPVVVKVNAPANSTTTLLPGETASVTVVEKQATNVLTIPTAAIVQQHGMTGVYLKAGTSSANPTSGTDSNSGSTPGNSGSNTNTSYNRPSSSFGNSSSNVPSGLQFVPVTVGLYGGNTVQIKSGLTQGEQVAIVTQTSSSTNGKNSSSSSNPISSIGGFGGTQGGFGGHGSYGGGFYSGSRGSFGGGNGSTGGGIG